MKGLLQGLISCLHFEVEEQQAWIFAETTRAPLQEGLALVSLVLPPPAPPPQSSYTGLPTALPSTGPGLGV